MKLCSNRTHLMEKKMVVTNFVNRGVGPFGARNVAGMLVHVLISSMERTSRSPPRCKMVP